MPDSTVQYRPRALRMTGLPTAGPIIPPATDPAPAPEPEIQANPTQAATAEPEAQADPAPVDKPVSSNIQAIADNIAKIAANGASSGAEAATGSPFTVPFLLMMLVTLGLFGLLMIMCFHEVPDKNAATVNTGIGLIATGWSIGVGYFWGSSAQSKTKDSTINTLVSK